ncbi:phosphoethanolamine transferase [Polaribacter sp. IC073]|uniref:phosphoethanolamine transferase n=1 Tax=Polaribacter sp. IC073 TaxID=2508540 RepID=UPI0011BEC0AA|nr:phosphoethanolamine transferase [Polaribacter sp. IC073]TXD48213.1 lipid A phosphoethanolamine transferase [Polaribacter sp. IC073]
MGKIKVYKKEILFHLFLNLLIAVFVSISSYIHIPFGPLKSVLVYGVHFFILQFSVFGFVYILSLFKNIFSVVFPLVFTVLASLAFWVYTQDITIEASIIQAILETKIDIAVDVFSFQFFLFVLLALCCSLFFIKKFRKLKKNSIKSPLFIAAVLAIISFFIVENYRFGVLKRKLPYNAFVAIKKYVEKSKIKLKVIEENISSSKENLHIIFVLGESVRADHLSLNGYARKTNPLLSQQQNIISFKNIETPLTYTAISVPQILTNKSVLDSVGTAFYSLFSILDSASFSSEWIGNQSLEKSYEAIVNSNQKVTIVDKFHSVLSFKKEKDLKILDLFKQDENMAKNKISTLHMIGSHWYYNSRYSKDFEIFTPTTNSKYIGSLSSEQLINSYDNTLLYLDFFLNNLIEELKKSSKETILIYLSDHGEILGENGQWFHAQQNKASENPAMLVWYSTNFKENNPEKIKNLISNKNKKYTTDFLFHSLLEISEIKNFKYNKELSIF